MTAVALALWVLAVPRPVEGPVAVLPFKNLSGDADLEWLRLGMAETLIADLKRSGQLVVVERTQVDRALTEIALQGARETEESTASRAGKMLGARTVVVGSFQRYGGAVRINARFVTVETGVIVDAAKATGPIAGVFALQDELIDKLIGRPAAQRPPRKQGRKSVRAFQLYAQSLAVASDVDRVGYLKSSLEADPDFIYAQEDLAALEKRMRGYSQTSGERLAVEEKASLSRVEDVRAPGEERLRAAASLLDGLRAARRFNTLVVVAARFTDAQGVDLREQAAFARFTGELGRHRFDAALAAGERFLKEFPTSTRFREVEKGMGNIVAERNRQQSRQQEYESDIGDLRGRLGDGRGLDAQKQLAWDYAPCIASRWNSLLGEVMFKSCSDFLARHDKDQGQDAREKRSAARFFVLLALDAKGELAAARALSEQVRAESHEWDEQLHLVMAEWPTDEPDAPSIPR